MFPLKKLARKELKKVEWVQFSNKMSHMNIQLKYSDGFGMD